MTRHYQHYNGNDARFNQAGFDKVLVVTSRYFDSALDDVESQLITYFNADRSHRTNPGVSFDNDNGIINRNGGNNVNEYRDRDAVLTEVIIPLRERLYRMGWVSHEIWISSDLVLL